MISICAPSYKRPNAVLTKKYIPGLVRYYVAPEEYDEYKKANPDEQIVKCAKGVQGNISRIRNYILDQEYERGADAVCIVDDDLMSLAVWDGNNEHKITPEELPEFLEKYTQLCREFGFKLWGMAVNKDRQTYKDNQPFSTTSFIGCPFHVTLKGSLPRYDENIPLKEDYDMTIQHCEAYRGCLRLNFAHYDAKQSVQAGGAASVRNHDEERRQLILLIKKWGSDIVRIDRTNKSRVGKKKQNIDYNPVIKIPIKGV